MFSYIWSNNFLFTERPYTKIARPVTHSSKTGRCTPLAPTSRPRTILSIIISCGSLFKLFCMCALARSFFKSFFLSSKHSTQLKSPFDHILCTTILFAINTPLYSSVSHFFKQVLSIAF
jgi:hypothetical protein